MKEKVKVQENGILDFGWTFYVVDRKDTDVVGFLFVFWGFFVSFVFKK